jgi:hypothetical protein
MIDLGTIIYYNIWFITGDDNFKQPFYLHTQELKE